ncbi:MAG: deoxyribodipyrimidine photolyase, partial [Betaproteobacteria bacterium]|nr:deoxyribodipyrimidine photolyase [Betaproteobacteria bacterium]
MKFFVEQALFEPTAAAAQARLQAFHPYQYAQSRNHLDGAVSMLSPYLTHGFLTVPEVAAHVYRVHRMSVQHKFIFELAWREYFLHVHDAIGDDVYQDIHQGVLPADAYTNNLPEDVRQGSTGVPAIDQSVRQLYFNGYLHNHARLWVASYLVHIRKVHWRAGADWMYSHLLDGDIASNHLSWQWVAGTGSSKPYLFNAANVALHAPESWHSPNTVIDKSMDIIEMISQSQATFTQKIVHHIKVDEPDLLDKPPPEAGLVASGLAADKLIDRDVWWIHPWSLSEQAPPKLPADAMRVAACWLEWTQAHPWN